MLCKLPLPDSTSVIKSDDINYFVNSVIKSWQISEDRLKQIIIETQKEDILQSVVLHIQNGWTDPDKTKVKLYLYKDPLTLYERLTLQDLHVPVPLTLRSEILNILHQGHIGIE